MVVFNYSGSEVNAKIVYYGPGLSGKTTNLEHIYAKMPARVKGKMVSMKTRTDRTLFFDFLPLELGDVNGFKIRFLLYTVPGQVYYNATRMLVLKGADAVVFVADSSRAKLGENVESLRNLEENLNEHGLSLDKIPWVIQYNKRDLPDALPVAELEKRLNVLGVPSFEAVATEGRGVYDTFQRIAALVYQEVKNKVKEEENDDGGTDAKDPGPAQLGRRKQEPEEPIGSVSDVVEVALREVGEPCDGAPPSDPADAEEREEDGEFQFAPLQEQVDERVGRVVNLEQIEEPAERKSDDHEFVTDPCRLPADLPSEKSGAMVPEGLMPETMVEPGELVVPVEIPRSRLLAAKGLRIVLQIKVKES